MKLLLLSLIAAVIAAPAYSATITVGPGKQFTTVGDALRSPLNDGDVIEVQAGTYTNDWAPNIQKSVTIKGVGGMARMVATQSPPNGKANFVVGPANVNVRFENIEFTGNRVSAQNGAGIRYEGGNLTIEKCYFHNNENGILGADAPDGTVTINLSEFAANGVASGSRAGYAHGVYLNALRHLTITNSWFHDTKNGHHIKSRASRTTIVSNRLDDGSGTASYNIDMPNGGVGLVEKNNIVQGANTSNSALIHYGGEAPAPAGSSLKVNENALQSHRAGPAIGVLNETGVVAEVTNNQRFGLSTTVQGPGACAGNSTLTAAIPVDQTSPWGSGGAVPPPPPPPPPGGCD